ncbi:MAG: PEP-CTERM sorting domain-containing protein [Verrucomicrobiota bacterium]
MSFWAQFAISFVFYVLSLGVSHGVVLSLSSGNVQLNYNDNSTTTASLFVDGVDNLYEYGFYYRQSNGSVTKLTNGTLIGSDTIRYEPQNDLEIDISFALPSTSAPDVNVSIEVSNDQTNDVDGSVIFYFDYDLNGGFTSHDATIAGDTITVTEPGGVIANITGTDADAYQIAAFSGLRTSIALGNQLNNTGNNFTNADFTGAFQWNFSLSTGQQVVFDSTTVIPEPSHYGLLVSVVLLFSIVRRKERRTEFTH